MDPRPFSLSRILTSVLTGQTTIGKFGKGRFEVRQGQANLREIRISENPESRATLNVTGGKLEDSRRLDPE